MSYPYPVDSSDSQTASKQVSTIPSFLAGIDMLSPVTGTATLTIYDSENSSTSGKKIIAEMEVDAGMPSCNHEYSAFVIANRGIYALLADPSNTSSFIVRYTLR